MRSLGFYVAGLLFGVFGTISYQNFQEPSCPTEDSCSPVWVDGEWKIEEVTP